MMTSSPGATKVRSARSMPSEPPTVTSTSCRGSYSSENRRLRYRAISARSSLSPALAVYWVRPRSKLRIPASRMAQGVLKSGSPTPRLMQPSISAAMSKKRRMPEGRIAAARGAISAS